MRLSNFPWNTNSCLHWVFTQVQLPHIIQCPQKCILRWAFKSFRWTTAQSTTTWLKSTYTALACSSHYIPNFNYASAPERDRTPLHFGAFTKLSQPTNTLYIQDAWKTTLMLTSLVATIKLWGLHKLLKVHYHYLVRDFVINETKWIVLLFMMCTCKTADGKT